MRKQPSAIIISRTDSIGDVVLTLPVAEMLRKTFPGAKLIFLGGGYTRPVAEACRHIDEFLDWQEISKQDRKTQLRTFRETGAEMIIHVYPVKEIAALAKSAGIPQRMGTTNRIYHWFTCNRLVRMSRRRSGLHEAQLNLKLIGRLTGMPQVDKEDIPLMYGLTGMKPAVERWASLAKDDRFNLILHPGSKGSAREWGTDNFRKLADILPHDRFRIFVTGTGTEGKALEESGFFDGSEDMINLTGRMDLAELISFIDICDGLVAASTGPLHLAAAMGKHALGIYPPIRPMHPGRWGPLGKNATCFVKEKHCNDCRNGGNCHCMREIQPEEIAAKLLQLC